MANLLDGILTRDLLSGGSPVPQRKALDFDSPGFALTDDLPNNKIKVSGGVGPWSGFTFNAIQSTNADLNLGASGNTGARSRRAGGDLEVEFSLNFVGTGRSWGTGALKIPLDGAAAQAVNTAKLVFGASGPIPVAVVSTATGSKGEMLYGTPDGTGHYVQVLCSTLALIENPPNSIFTFSFSVPL